MSRNGTELYVGSVGINPFAVVDAFSLLTPDMTLGYKICSSSMSDTIYGCKLPRQLENPFDDLLMVAIEPLLAPLRDLGVTPNAISWASIASAVASIGLAFHGFPVSAACLWLFNYVCDVADGFMARRYRMETEFGGQLDHYGDVLAFCGLMAFVASRLSFRPWWPLGVEAFLVAATLYHLSCQEVGSKHQSFDGIDGSSCLDKHHLRWTRWFGVGTLTLWHIFLIMFYSVI